MLPREEWISFIPGAHPGYITLDQHDANRARLTANAAARGRDRTAGPPREGPGSSASSTDASKPAPSTTRQPPGPTGTTSLNLPSRLDT
jgi:hypothetical protein